MFVSLRDYAVHGWNMLRSSLIGVWIGILPGVGSTIASIVAYTTAKNLSRTPEDFGKGSEEAIVAAESANNATTGGTLIPLMTLGISGGLTDSILLGALIIHNFQPGPLLFRNHPQIVNTIFASHLVAHVVMFAMMTFGIAIFARLMRIPRAFVLPMVVVFSVSGRLRPQQSRFRHLGDAGVRHRWDPDGVRQGPAGAIRRRPRAGAGGGVGARARVDGAGGKLHAARRATDRLDGPAHFGSSIRLAVLP